ncbi:dual specificity phosphatase catalytic domain protein [Penicillium angulare]|uniref:Dual specificity phosphatase catalytic domain protein n=1 Tax=Penicillium angulare TaxID=116970 RepID=A0A9W9FIM2_9EURO|nr:dual specificity phosphatase catalytic domain protein [Penicillium angulare]
MAKQNKRPNGILLSLTISRSLDYFTDLKGKRRAWQATTDENRSGEDVREDRNKKWELAFKARVKHVVPGLFLEVLTV